MTEYLVPTDIDFTDEQVAKMNTRKELNEGFYRFLIADAEREVVQEDQATEKTPGGTLRLSIKALALKDPEDPESGVKPPVYFRQVIPLDNPHVEGHVAPEYAASMAPDFVAALFPERITARPQFNKQEKAWYHEGELIDKADKDQINYQRCQEAAEVLKEVWSEPSSLIDVPFYAYYKEKDGYKNLKGMRAEMAEDDVLTDPNDFFTTPTVPQVTSGANGAKKGNAGRAKPAKKARRKKN